MRQAQRGEISRHRSISGQFALDQKSVEAQVARRFAVVRRNSGNADIAEHMRAPLIWFEMTNDALLLPGYATDYRFFGPIGCDNQQLAAFRNLDPVRAGQILNV